VNTTLRTAGPEDHAAIRRVHLEAFPTAAEADLVERLRRDGDAAVELVADHDGAAIGHVMLSAMQAPFPALGLGPVGVLAAHRGQGVAERLIRNALRRAREGGWRAVFVLGDPAYYRRFGFRAEHAAGFECAWSGPCLMALPLEGTMPATRGRIDYAPAFADLS
jgi:putative acetyltransferase